ncbi:HAD-IIA family hydrolase [Campylobacter sp. MIT 21-1685]|uniref:HAD-IIA family hydrolase n=1 Tax=unclassified Campylobacter TaxID=2593542 RepID=UPI00224B4E68|nr:MULTISPECIES: HAD-IIA family hydrolase [unclassified Campylobacter]MCX2683029.1 HAD-IIA family hydrolase [Campylobacter sp. MIT 21-1684]MCX2751311.1 HAD-IIA family hydrolase [Campylobacter sp. MIT 21-1682]MCX2807510.1 HAD-IIA family hydrolase [Campylobacter sp. MIT 21-1685]
MFFIDVQGTLLSDSDKSLIAGAKELFACLNSEKQSYVVLTNNTKNLDFLHFLREKGLQIKDKAYLDPFCVFANILKPCKIAAFGSEEFLQSLQSLGFKFDYKEPQALLIASYDNFSFKDFANMIAMIKKGVKVIAMHETSIYKKDGYFYPGVGSIMLMLLNAVHFEYQVVGKPSVAFYEEALRLLQMQDPKARFENTILISDDFKGDLIQAKKLGMKTVLVLSGKTSDTKGIDTNFLDAIYPSILEFTKEYNVKFR